MFDPNLPQPNTPADADVIRAQLNALNDKIDAQAAIITTQAAAITALQATVAANLADTSHNIWGQMPNLDPNYQPSDPASAADLLWVVARMIEFNNGLARG